MKAFNPQSGAGAAKEKWARRIEAVRCRRVLLVHGYHKRQVILKAVVDRLPLEGNVLGAKLACRDRQMADYGR